MENNFSEKITNKMITKKVINKEEAEIYAFGFHQLILIILNIISILIIGSIFNKFLFSLLFLIEFIPLRCFAGGIHANTQLKCYIFSMIYYFGMMAILSKINILTFFILTVGCLMIIIIFFLVPIEDKNNPLSRNQYENYKNKAKFILIIEGFAFIFSLFLNINTIYQSCFFTLFTIFILLILGKIKSII